MKLSKVQREFTLAIAQIINYAYAKGYELTVGDFYRDSRLHGNLGEKKSYSSRNSCHKIRLAGDLNLWIDDKYIEDGSHNAWLDIGEEWERIHPLARWGGRFNDANHLSFEYNGFK
jgi:hypothetical protein